MDITKINDVFDNSYNIVPPELQKYSNTILSDIKSIENMKLSPSSPFMNDSVRQFSNSIMGVHGKFEKTSFLQKNQSKSKMSRGGGFRVKESQK